MNNTNNTNKNTTSEIPADASPATDALEFHDDLSANTFRVLASDGIKVGKYADPTEEMALDLSPENAAAIAREDAGLLFLYS